MKSIEELKQLYEADLRPQLEGIEKQRKAIKLLWRSGTALIIFLFVFFNLLPEGFIRFVVGAISVIAILFLFGKGLVIYYRYRKVFKKEVVSKIVNLINPEYNYNSDKHISSTDFVASKLFKKTPHRCKGDDYISGQIEKTDFEFSELKAQYKTVTTEDGKRKEEWHTIFQGLFFHANFNKHIQGTTFVLPDTAERLFGKLGQKLQKMSNRGELVKLENPAFEKEFVVYSSNQQEARYILTPTMMEAMVSIRQNYKLKMSFSFIGERVYCAVEFKKGLFEPRIKKSGVNFSDVEEMFQLFGLIETIIHEMNLNTRIWTKD